MVQHAGQILHVQAGWAHQLRDLAPSIKLAYDQLRVDHSLAYAWTHHHILPTIAPKMGVMDMMVSYMVERVAYSLVQ